jgi:tetratricopeptide (TPR) repeat protein
MRDDRGLLEPVTGQRCLDFPDPENGNNQSGKDYLTPPVDEPASPATIRLHQDIEGVAPDRRLHWSSEQWFEQGCRLLDEHDVGGAVDAFRLALMGGPGSPEVHFHLAEALYRAGNRDGALERYYAAVEVDGNYLEAWTQIGCIHSARGELQSALESFRIALSVHEDYPDAHWNCGDVLAQLGRAEEAAVHWRKYLQFDSDGPWAEQARQRLESSSGPTSGQ